LICPTCLIVSPSALNQVVTRPSSWPENVATNVPQSNSPSNGSLNVNASRVRCPAPAAVAAIRAMTAAMIAIEVGACLSRGRRCVDYLTKNENFQPNFAGLKRGMAAIQLEPTLMT
jgi:hypothetical protein